MWLAALAPRVSASQLAVPPAFAESTAQRKTLADSSGHARHCLRRARAVCTMDAAAADFFIRPAMIAEPLDEAAYRRCIASQAERTYWPGWEEQRVVSVRWSTFADVTILIAVAGPSASPSLNLKIIGTAEVIGPLDATPGGNLPRRCLLRDVWVAEPYRRRGIARSLVRAAEELALSSGVGFVSLEVTGDNEAALGLYTRLGYAERAGDSPADALMSPFAAAIKRLPGWARGTLVLGKELSLVRICGTGNRNAEPEVRAETDKSEWT